LVEISFHKGTAWKALIVETSEAQQSENGGASSEWVTSGKKWGSAALGIGHFTPRSLRTRVE